ncbi:MAG: CidA/LrgA family protein [Acidaminococcaceae bacterium]|nr:CidA/LrgA family protein [Acidaminococcaceae bacterium]
MNADALLKGTAVLLALQWVSVLIVNALGLKFPPSLLGMLLLAVLLLKGIIRLEVVEDICTLLIKKMGMLFLPAAVGIMLYVQEIQAEALAIFATIIITSLIILLTTAGFLELALRNKKGDKPL